MGLKAGWLALFAFVYIIGAFLGSTFEYQSAAGDSGVAYSTGVATFITGNSTVEGSGTSWNASMEDGNIKADADNEWTKILTVDDANTLTLYSPYTGTGGVDVAYTMAVSPGWVGTGSGGYAQSPITTFDYLTDVSNVTQGTSMLGFVPLPIPNGEYFKSAFRVITWRWSFLEDYEMFWLIFCAPFVLMGVLSMILLIYGIVTGNLTLT